MDDKLHYELTVAIIGQRLDTFLRDNVPNMSRSQIQRFIKGGSVEVNGCIKKGASQLKSGDTVILNIPVPKPSHIEAESIPLSIVYEDSDLVVLDKPSGLVVHPSPSHPRHTLVNALLGYSSDLSGVGGVVRPGIIHRLDKDTSGLMVIAKNDRAHQYVSAQIKERKVKKGYTALVWGTPKASNGVIDGPVGRDPLNRKRMAVVSNGRESITRYRVLKSSKEVSLLEIFPETGRTHQIRVHLLAIGHPLVGDAIYGPKKKVSISRQFLHAHILGFCLPIDGKFREFRSPLPPDLQMIRDNFAALSLISK